MWCVPSYCGRLLFLRLNIGVDRVVAAVQATVDHVAGLRRPASGVGFIDPARVGASGRGCGVVGWAVTPVAVS